MLVGRMQSGARLRPRYVHRWYALPIEREEFPALAAYCERLKKHEPFQKWIVGQGV